MDEFIYQIDKIFSISPDGVLGQNDCSSYYIGPYQRGYKWGSSTRFEQVPQMLIDIYEAMSAGTSEYYLQYITVKKKSLESEDKNVLEVIDGQQRLTTLSLLFYRIEQFCPIANCNIAKNRVSYARYTMKNIFEEVNDKLKNGEDPETASTQDLFYMMSAAKCIDLFLELLNKESSLEKFIHYVRQNVLLIVNLESEFISSEEVFANLNGNKVKLTDTYLIKGLLLTNAVHRTNSTGVRKNYQEILDQRRIMGRTWDEIMSWISNKNVAHYFFGSNNQGRGMECLLDFVYDELVQSSDQNKTENDSLLRSFSEQLKSQDPAAKEGISKNNSKYTSTDPFPLFNKYNDIIKHPEDASKALSELKRTYMKMRGVYENHSDSTTYNLLGFVLFSDNLQIDSKWKKDSGDKLWKSVLDRMLNESAASFKAQLAGKTLDLIPDMESDISLAREEKSRISEEPLTDVEMRVALKRFRYASSNPNLRNLLLSFSVFPEISDKSYRFDFCQYDSEDWSFEHIFPQHPNNKLRISKLAIPAVCEAILSRKDEEPDDDIKQRLDSITEKIKEENVLEKEEIDNIGFLYDCDFDIHQCGNMALLSGGDNSALSNNPYIAKRPILMQKAISGSFIPAHTMSIFSKTLIASGKPFAQELSKWTEKDVTAHMYWQIERNKKIREDLSNEYREI